MPFEEVSAELLSLVEEISRLVAQLHEAVRRLTDLELRHKRELARDALDELERARRRGLDGRWLP